ncbi:hypothetical protein [Sphingosinicella sp. BN140058]|uniref:hypothetical protein n=1 Tax=Sphingosinicella sp. BN140058 TaxID=1892855 RepID=UPI001010C2BF|nr:hypothetical protein [Sphingosinicella sp. BN140058]QAY77893.1 hypothetical protein ETR14_16230 [Sphingosinicella sp. BN140058]
MTLIFEDEERAIAQLKACKASAENMRDSFKYEGLSIDAESWSAVVSLLEQALHRFGDAT